MGRVQLLFGIALGVLLACEVDAQHVEILQGPQSTNVIASSNVTFRVIATGAEPLNYQWFFENGAIQGATNSNLTITNVRLSDVGLYHVVVSNSFSWIPTDRARLEVLIRPVQVQHPEGAILLAGETLNLSAAVTGHPPPFTYVWRRFGIVVDSQTSFESNATFVVENVGSDSAGGWSVMVTNIAGIASPVAPARVVVVTRAPSDQPAVLGGIATFRAEVAAAGDTVNYQWQFNGTNIPGATSTNLTIAPVRVTNAGLYSLTMTAPFPPPGRVRTFDARLAFAGPPQVVTHPRSQVVDASKSVLLAGVIIGSGPLSYQWFLNGSPVPGATTSELAISNVTQLDAGTYKLFVTNPLGEVTTDPAVLTVRPAPQLTAFRGMDPRQAVPLRIESPTPFVLEASTNLLHWTPIFTSEVPTELFIDLNRFPQRFYRARR